MSLDDERTQFYLRHREQIEEWAALRSEVAAAMDEWLTTLLPDFEALAQSLLPDVKLRAQLGDNQSLCSYRLYRPSWSLDDEDDEAAVALEWGRRKTTMYKGNTPYVGLRTPRTCRVGRVVRPFVELRDAALARGDTYSQTEAFWPASSYVRPGPEFPRTTDEYRAALVDTVRDAWAAYAPVISSAIRAMNARPRPTPPAVPT